MGSIGCRSVITRAGEALPRSVAPLLSGGTLLRIARRVPSTPLSARAGAAPGPESGRGVPPRSGAPPRRVPRSLGRARLRSARSRCPLQHFPSGRREDRTVRPCRAASIRSTGYAEDVHQPPESEIPQGRYRIERARCSAQEVGGHRGEDAEDHRPPGSHRSGEPPYPPRTGGPARRKATLAQFLGDPSGSAHEVGREARE